jgi:hypothetical protein
VERVDLIDDCLCPLCNENVHVYKPGIQTVFVRKNISDIGKYEDVHVAPYLKEAYQVIEKTFEKGKYKLALKGYRKIDVEFDKCFDCVWGYWDGDVDSI